MALQETIVRMPNPPVGVEFDLAVEDWMGYVGSFCSMASLSSMFGLKPLALGVPTETKGRFKLVFGKASIEKEGVTPHYFWLRVFDKQYYRDDGYRAALRRACYTDGQQEYFPVLTLSSEEYFTKEQLEREESRLLWLVKVP